MKKWHTLKFEDILEELKTSEKGLNENEAKVRLKKFGQNKFLERRRIEPIKIFLSQFKSYLIIILLAATIISAVIGEITDAAIILAILIINATLGFTQEFKAEKAMEALKKLAAPKARVIREGKQEGILAEKLVPGDIILLESGDKVPADARLIEVMTLKVDESPLTGESIPISKNIRILKDVTVADRKNMVFLGTTVSYGRARAVVTNTGMETEMGKIAKMIQVKEEMEVTPLQTKLNEFGKWMGTVVLIAAAMTFLIGILRGEKIFGMFFTAIALAVSAVPEGLPAIVTATLALGMRRLAKSNALIRKLSAVETLGCATVIAADKTGTMTTNEMTVRKLFCNDKFVNITKVGFEPRGEFICDGVINPKEDEHVKLLLRISLLCNNGELEYKEGKWGITGDPTECALLVAAAKADMWKDKVKNYYHRIAEFPFSSERKRMTTIHNTSEGIFAYVKGAPETILDICDNIYKNKGEKKLTKKERERILNITQKMASDGLRVIAVAYKKITRKVFTPEIVERDLIFVGLAGMIDPPREEVKKAIEVCKQAGIKVIMLTGDHKQTALAIARELELIEVDSEEALTGIELEKLTDEELEERVEKIKVYARVSPEHKVRVLKALKKKGHIVAMTGDGVNDAPALKKADIGVSMGIKGTDVAKEASDMVLTDDNFATIVKAVEEGRGIYDNIRKFIRFLLCANFDEIVEISIPILLFIRDPVTGAIALPFLPIHILWINLITDGLPALALSVDPKDPDAMKKPPRDPKRGILSGMLLFIIVAAILDSISSLSLFVLELQATGSILKARTMAVTAAIMFELFFVFNCRSEKRSLFRTNPLSNKKLVIAVIISILLQMAIIYIPALQNMFGMVALDIMDWVKIVLFSSIGLFIFPEIFMGRSLKTRK